VALFEKPFQPGSRINLSAWSSDTPLLAFAECLLIIRKPDILANFQAEQLHSRNVLFVGQIACKEKPYAKLIILKKAP
jgi:hypothetical protein